MSLKEHLEILSRLRPGETLSLGKRNGLPRALPKDSALTALTRYWGAESWGKTFQYLENLFTTALREPRLRPEIAAALSGLDALRSTYSGQRGAVVSLSLLQRRVRSALEEGEKAPVEVAKIACLAQKQEPHVDEDKENLEIVKPSTLSQKMRLAYSHCRPYLGPAQQAARVVAFLACFL